jgi:virulence-associated protein VagC
LNKWINYLDLLGRPNFGDVHTKNNAISSEYFRPDSIQDFQYRLLDTLTGRFEVQSVLLTGIPGAGKTTFLYFLKKWLENAPSHKYILHIFHANKARGHNNTQDAETAVQLEILEAWESFYVACGKKLLFSEIKQSYNNRYKSLLTALSNYYKKNKDEFPFILIFAVDDVDIATEDEINNIVRMVISNIEIRSVKRWFLVRPQTYKHYSPKTKELLQGFFPDARDFPSIKLYDLFNYRVGLLTKLVESNLQKTPFSPHLCSYIEQITAGSLRLGLTVLEKILTNVAPPNSTDKSEEFIRNYIDKAAIKILVKEKILIDIHDPDLRCTQYPIPIDLLRFLRFTGDVAVIKACISDSLEQRYRKSSFKRIVNQSQPVRSPYPRDNDIDFSLQALQTALLIEKKGNSFVLTPLGKVVATFSSQPYFLEESMISEMYTDDMELYKAMAAVKIDHENIAYSYLMRRF